MKRNWILILAMAASVYASPARAIGITGSGSIDTRIQEELATSDVLRGGDQTVAQRLSTSFGVSTDVLLQEKAALGGWTDVFVAHTLQANTRIAVTTSELVQMRMSGMSWTRIANEVRVPKGRLVEAVKIQTRLAERSRSGVEGKIQSRVEFLDREAARSGDQSVAQRLATQFGVSTDALLQEKASFNADWSDLFLAHTIQANSRTAATVDELFQMRASGMTWSQIGMAARVPARRLEKTVKIEARNMEKLSLGGKTNGRLQAQIDLLNAQAARLGDQGVAERLSARLGVSANALLQERTQFQTSWGDIFLAHTIAQSARTTVTTAQLLQMRTNGMAWTQIARDVRFSNGKLMTAFRTGTTETFDTELTAGSSLGTRMSGNDRNASVRAGMDARVKSGAKLRSNGGSNCGSITNGTRASMKATTRATMNASAKASMKAALKAQRIQSRIMTNANLVAKVNGHK